MPGACASLQCGQSVMGRDEKTFQFAGVAPRARPSAPPRSTKRSGSQPQKTLSVNVRSKLCQVKATARALLSRQLARQLGQRHGVDVRGHVQGFVTRVDDQLARGPKVGAARVESTAEHRVQAALDLDG